MSKTFSQKIVRASHLKTRTLVNENDFLKEPSVLFCFTVVPKGTKTFFAKKSFTAKNSACVWKYVSAWTGTFFLLLPSLAITRSIYTKSFFHSISAPFTASIFSSHHKVYFTRSFFQISAPSFYQVFFTYSKRSIIHDSLVGSSTLGEEKVIVSVLA